MGFVLLGSGQCKVFCVHFVPLGVVTTLQQFKKKGNFSLKCCKGLAQFLSIECAGKSLYKEYLFRKMGIDIL